MGERKRKRDREGMGERKIERDRSRRERKIGRETGVGERCRGEREGERERERARDRERDRGGRDRDAREKDRGEREGERERARDRERDRENITKIHGILSCHASLCLMEYCTTVDCSMTVIVLQYTVMLQSGYQLLYI